MTAGWGKVLVPVTEQEAGQEVAAWDQWLVRVVLAQWDEVLVPKTEQGGVQEAA